MMLNLFFWALDIYDVQLILIVLDMMLNSSIVPCLEHVDQDLSVNW